MTIVRTHKDLTVWRKAVSLAGRIYAVTEGLVRYDRYGLPAQMRRSAVSVASNIAEGAARGNRAEYIRFLSIARGSLSELETQVCIGLELRLIDPASRIEEQVVEVGKLLSALHRRLREDRERARGFEPPPRAPLPSH